MLYLTIGAFALSAVMGLIVAIAIFTKKPETPKPAVYAHGVLAATALVLLFIYAMNNPANYPQLSLILFVAAAVGGFYLFINDFKNKPGPVSVVVIHALLAVTAFVLLLAFAFL